MFVCFVFGSSKISSNFTCFLHSLDSWLQITASFSSLCWVWKWSNRKHFFFILQWVFLLCLTPKLFQWFKTVCKPFPSCSLSWTRLLRMVDNLGSGGTYRWHSRVMGLTFQRESWEFWVFLTSHYWNDFQKFTLVFLF